MSDVTAEEGGDDGDDEYTQQRLSDVTPAVSYQCLVCGAVSTDEAEIAACHSHVTPSYRDIPPGESGSSVDRFVFPDSLDPTFASFARDAAQAVATEPETPLRAAAAVVRDYVELGSHAGSPAVDLFAHLVCLQTTGVLPGYPRYTTTMNRGDDAGPTPLSEFCSTHRVAGTVTDADITACPLVTRTRVYRAKVPSVTDSFWDTTPVISQPGSRHQSQAIASPPWAAVTSASVLDGVVGSASGRAETFTTAAAFHESAAHTAVIKETRHWLEDHPAVQWTSAPYVRPVPDEARRADAVTTAGSRDTPLWMGDVAAFTGDASRPDVVAAVVAEESPAAVCTTISWLWRQDALPVVVMPNRTAILTFLAHGVDAGRFESDLPVSQLDRQPSLIDLNTAIARNIPAFSNEGKLQTLFLTRKQLIDDTLPMTAVMSSE